MYKAERPHWEAGRSEHRRWLEELILEWEMECRNQELGEIRR